MSTARRQSSNLLTLPAHLVRVWLMCNRLAWTICNPSMRSKSSTVKITPMRTDGTLHSVSFDLDLYYCTPSKLFWSNKPLSLLVHGLGECLGCLGAIPCCFCCPNPFKPVAQGEVGLITRFGRFVNPHDDHSRIYILIDVLPDSNVPSIPVWSK